MNDLIVDVKLWGESVGSLYWEKESNAALFDYERKFIRSGLDISPIIMPISQYRNTPYRFLENRTDCFKGLPGLFADSLPDTFGNQIINEWFASKGLSGEEITPLDRLCYVGDDGLGLGTSGRCSHFQYIQNVSSFLAQLDLKSHSVREYGFGKLRQFLDMEH